MRTVLVALPPVRAYTQKSPCVHAGAFWAAATRGAVASTAATAIANTVTKTRDLGGRRIGVPRCRCHGGDMSLPKPLINTGFRFVGRSRAKRWRRESVKSPEDRRRGRGYDGRWHRTGMRRRRVSSDDAGHRTTARGRRLPTDPGTAGETRREGQDDPSRGGRDPVEDSRGRLAEGSRRRGATRD